MDAQTLIQTFQLMAHDEGGYFRQLYESDWTVPCPDRPGHARPGLNTIYYMLTSDSPVGHFHRNRSDIVHFFHADGPLEYWLVWPDGRLETLILGSDPTRGHVFQMTVPGGVWKATRLLDGDYGLLSEAVAPGFDYRDRELAEASGFKARFPHLWEACVPLIATPGSDR